MAIVIFDTNCWDKDFTEQVIKTDYEHGSMLDDVIRTGLKKAKVLPADATYGDMIQALVMDVDKDCVSVEGKDGNMTFTIPQEIWTMPYTEVAKPHKTINFSSIECAVGKEIR